MKLFYLIVPAVLTAWPAFAQTRKMAVIGSSTSAGLAASPADSAWVNRFNYYHKYQLGILDSTYNLAVSGTTVYSGMPGSYTPPGGRPAPDPAHNITKAVSVLSDVAVPTNGVIILNFPTNGYDVFTIPEIMSRLQTIYDSATRTGNRCFITTTQPRMDGNFATSAVKRKLAVIKDSILNRFGTANTINFWDGMFNPADTTILPAYSAGDNVHFNNAGHRELFNRVVAKNVFSLTATAATGDYRSNVNPTGLWSDVASWQVYNGSGWVTASAPPDASSGAVTIVNGDSIRINLATSIDQVTVESGGILTIFNTDAPTTFTLNDGPGVDIAVNGKLYVSAGATLTGSGTVQNNSTGTFILRNQGILAVNTTNNGTTNVSGTGNIQNTLGTNYGTLNLVDFTLNLNNATLNNYGVINILFNSNAFIASTAGNGILINNAGGSIFKSNAAGIAQITNNVAFTNNGTIKGVGQFTFSNTTSNTGIISPGASPGLLIVNPAFTNGNPVIDLEIATTGAVAGTNYDRLQFSTVGSLVANVTGASLRVTDMVNDPVGTVYTLLSFPSGTITGPFANVTLSGSLGNLVYGSNAITVQKISALPLTWGNFTATANNRQVILNWETLQESNTAYFVIEHATDNTPFTNIGTVPAAGNSHEILTYIFKHTTPATNTNNYYRLRQVDVNARHSYSAIRTVQLNNENINSLLLYPNPVSSILHASMYDSDGQITINTPGGKEVCRQPLINGITKINVGHLPAGMYYITVYRKQKRLGTQAIIKL